MVQFVGFVSGEYDILLSSDTVTYMQENTIELPTSWLGALPFQEATLTFDTTCQVTIQVSTGFNPASPNLEDLVPLTKDNYSLP